MSKVACSSWFVEVPHVVRSAEDVWDTEASVGTVDAGRMVPTAAVDCRVRICPADGQQGRHRQKGQHPLKGQR